LDHFVSAGRVNDYYETVFSKMIADGTLKFESILFAKERWYEIDTVEDIYACERMFLKQTLLKLKPKNDPSNETVITDQCKLFKNQSLLA